MFLENRKMAGKMTLMFFVLTIFVILQLGGVQSNPAIGKRNFFLNLKFDILFLIKLNIFNTVRYFS